jgi:hypothetical protein
MIIEKTIRFILLGGLAIALIIYHVLEVLQDKFLIDKSDMKSWLDLMTIGRIIATFILVIITIRLKPIVKLLLGQAYISGDYKGISRESNQPGIRHIEEFTIAQSILWTRISGCSFLESGQSVSTWKGRAIEYDGNREFKFVVDLETSDGPKFGIISLMINNGKAIGYYRPNAPNKNNFVSTIECATLELLGNQKVKQ